MFQLLDDRIAHINETIKQTSAQVQFFTQNLQNSTQQLQALHGHLNECLHWKQTLVDAKPQEVPLIKPESSKEQDDGEAISEESEQAA